MALDPTPWIIGGGAAHSPEVVRQSLYDSTSGAEGISSVGALKVQAQATPGASVRVAPGGSLLNNRYPGGAGQSYSARNASQTTVPVAATGSSGGRTDAVILRIVDPQYAGQPPADPNNFQYTRLETATAPAGITDISQLSLAYPAILLARITIPANTGTITSGMITDLRKVAQPRRETALRTHALTGSDSSILSNTTAYPSAGQSWPPSAETGLGSIDIPSWATRMKIVMWWGGINVPAGDARGLLWVQVGQTVNPDNVKTQGVTYNGVNSSNASRTTMFVADERPVPVALRGTSQAFYPRGNAVPGTAAAYWRVDSGSNLYLQVEFMEQAD